MRKVLGVPRTPAIEMEVLQRHCAIMVRQQTAANVLNGSLYHGDAIHPQPGQIVTSGEIRKLSFLGVSVLVILREKGSLLSDQSPRCHAVPRNLRRSFKR